MDSKPIYSGKVRDIYEIGKEHLMMIATDKVSSFDRHIGIIPGKGELLNQMSEFWFNNTKHIVDNHLLSIDKNVAFVKKCTPIMLEIIVRGYIAGNTQTSLWTHYSNGRREYCGITFPDGLKKNQKLDFLVVTPTTKGEVDVPISREEIIADGSWVTEAEYDFMQNTALKLFNFGQKVADAAGFILVDTKYEFGRTINGEIILIDELHTCDSSRYWFKESYDAYFAIGQEPDKLDKDCVRDWVKSKCDPYKDDIPEIPNEIVKRAHDSYERFLYNISQVNIYQVFNKNIVVILSGSEKDKAHVDSIRDMLYKHNHKTEVISIVASAHKNTRRVLTVLDKYNSKSEKVIYVTVAGRSNALSGVVAANTTRPVIACPPFADKMDMMVNIHSTLQMPRGVPVMTILEPINVALTIERLFII